MSVILNPYVSFQGNAAEALEFYHGVFGGDVQSMKFGDMPDMPGNDPALADQVMHGQINGDNQITLMASDLPPSMGQPKNGTISLSGDDETILRGWWDKLAEGGTVTLPLNQAPWGDSFGQLQDKFGVDWMVNIAGGQQAAG